jgi:ribosome maturation factor RimP
LRSNSGEEKGGVHNPFFYSYLVMITEEKLRLLIEQQIEGTSSFLVDVKVADGNQIKVLIDDLEGFSIRDAVGLSRYLEKTLDRDIEDFALSVSSPGLDQPFKVTKQYVKNIGRQVKVKLLEGGSVEGALLEADEQGILVKSRSKERIEGRKAKEWVETDHKLGYSQISETKVVIVFK